MSCSRTCSLRARDIMTPEPVCVSPSAGIRELAQAFEDHEISGAPVTDQQGRVIGVVSKTDLIRRCSEGDSGLSPTYLFEVISERQPMGEQIFPEPLVCVGDFMTEEPLTVSPETPVAEIAAVMSQRRVHRVIVTDKEGFPVGIVTSMDLLDCFGNGKPGRTRGASAAV